MMPTSLLSENYAIFLALIAAAASGLVGSFALMKRMTLAGDVISHVALPGLGLALLYNINPVLGGGTTLLLGTILIWGLGEKTSLSTETTIGVIFAASLAVGALITPSEELVEALFGEFAPMSLGEFILGLIAVTIVVSFIFLYKNKLIINLFSPELAAASGIHTARLNLYFLLIFSLTVLMGLRFLGALLMGSLIIIPAAIGRQLAHTFDKFLIASCLASITSVALGFIISSKYNLELGPTVVAVASGLFVLSLLKKKK